MLTRLGDLLPVIQKAESRSPSLEPTPNEVVPHHGDDGADVESANMDLPIGDDSEGSWPTLTQSEERLALALDALEGGIWDWSISTGKAYFSDKWSEMLGYPPGQFADSIHAWKEAIHPRDRVRVVQALRSHFDQTVPHYECEYRLRSRNGEWIWVSDRGRVVERDEDGKPTRMTGASINSTKRREYERQLRLRERALESSLTATAFSDPEGRITYANQAFLDLWGIQNRQEVVGRRNADLPGEVRRAQEIARSVFRNGAWRGESSAKRGDGVAMEPEISAAMVRDVDGAPTQSIVTLVDITERKRSEAMLRKSELRFRRMVDSLPEMIWMSGVDRRFIFVNAQWLLFRGGNMEAELGDGWTKGVHPDDLDECLRSYQSAADQFLPFALEHRMLHRDGEYRWVLNNGIPRRDENGEFAGYIGSCVDVTGRKKAEEEISLKQAELSHFARLSTMGELAAGLAHELNQPLAAITAYSQGFLRFLEQPQLDPEDLRGPIQRIADEALRAGEVVRSIRSLVRRREPRRSTHDLAELMQTAVKLLRRECSAAGITIACEIPPRRTFVIVDATQIQQVLLNLMRNSIEAIQGSDRTDGKILMKTLRSSDDTVTISVCDDGPGIAEDVFERAFDPFVTTKPDGMGMGLSICQSIMADHQGAMTVGSNVWGGAEFRFTLPRHHN
ncbi:MAG: PAS domain-containing protein [Pirellulaceae bacterium]|jgi:PAS domain S-box-containing protein|nr:PAS domain-containing protein [Pirellulaceae bacterium]MDP7016453.1 PAS domain-containing protein [Pirellulaceae bacterium]